MTGAPVVTTRYGVFLIPDDRTCAAVTAVAAAVKARYGFVSAGAFPPHATLAGSLPVDDPEALADAIGAVLARHRPFTVENTGVRMLGSVVIYDVDASDGERNPALLDLALAVDAAVRPLLVPTGGLPADVHDAADFHAHLSLASHELLQHPELGAEVAAFAAGLDVAAPARFVADTVTLFRFEHPTWAGEWWRGMRWEPVRTWTLGGRVARSG